MMTKITYAQEHRQNSRQIRGSYFYVRTHYLKEFHFNGEWYLPENATYIQSCINQIPQFELDKLSHPKPQPTDAVLGSDAVFQKWLSTAAVLGGKAKNKDFM